MTTLLDLTQTERAPATARRLSEAALDFLGSLNESQYKAATLPFGDDRRYVWDYRPPESTPRNGLRLINMSREQQAKALAVLDIALSTRGAQQVRQIIDLETPLRESEQTEGRVTIFIRDPEHYAFCVFGDPSGRAPWAWHVGGHHVGLHVTVVDGDRISTAPLFFGANPAQVRHGPSVGQRTLPDEEDLARALVRSLPSDQKRIAVVNAIAPADIITDKNRVCYPFNVPRGLSYSAMAGDQRGLLLRLIRHYVERASDELCAFQWARIEKAGLDPITFAWAGPEEPGHGHYYAIKGPSFLIEYDNTQNGANHIHSVLRDIAGDWGEDILAAHYAESHQNGHH